MLDEKGFVPEKCQTEQEEKCQMLAKGDRYQKGEVKTLKCMVRNDLKLRI